MAFEQFISAGKNAATNDAIVCYKVQITTETGMCSTLHISGACLETDATVRDLTEQATKVAKESMGELQRARVFITMQEGAVVWDEEKLSDAIFPKVVVVIKMIA